MPPGKICEVDAEFHVKDEGCYIETHREGCYVEGCLTFSLND